MDFGYLWQLIIEATNKVTKNIAITLPITIAAIEPLDILLLRVTEYDNTLEPVNVPAVIALYKLSAF